MKIQNTFIGLFAIVLLARSPYGLASSDRRLVLTDDDTPIVKREANELSDGTDPTIATASITNESSISSTTTTTTSITTDPSTSSTTTTTTSITTDPSTSSPTATTTSITTESSTSPTTIVDPTSSPTTTQSPTPGAPGRKFDGLSFFGGMILVVGLGALIYLVIRYLRRSNRLPYSNLH